MAPMPRIREPIGEWLDAIRRIEDLGYSSVAISDHFTQGWVMDAIVAMAAAASATRRLRILSLVLGNDYRHPILTHKAIATLDLISGGRVELGIGAGWMESDYTAAGIPFDRPGVRLARLEESLRIIAGLFGDGPFSFRGEHYRIEALDGLPKSVQRPRPPILVGGGGPRALAIAARHADIVGLHARLPDGRLTSEAAEDLSAERMTQKVGWVRTAAADAGRSSDDIELQATVYLTRISDSGRTAAASISTFATLLAADPALVASSPAVLVGSVEQCVDTLIERRERFGISYVNLGSDLDAVAPIVARLAGR
jgi:probable F420-dependent oxidoreductase